MAIRFATFQAGLGAVLVAATEKGLCRVALGDAAPLLENELEAEFARAVLERDEPGLAPYIESLRHYLEGNSKALDLPLDIQATAFQRRVWQLLQQIPYGQTRSYSELAAQLGSPNAVRAVAGACASNPVALVIPCHRVVQKGGKLAGYRWGLERKAALLAHEKGDNDSAEE